MDEQFAVVVVGDQREVVVAGDVLLAARLDDGIYVPVRGLCEALGLDRKAQLRRIQRDETLAEDMREIVVDTVGGPQPVQMLRVETVPFWLSTITINKVRTELQDKIRDYKRWVVRKVYEAYAAEADQAGSAPDETALSPVAEAVAELERIRDLYQAMARMAQEQINLAQRTEAAHRRLDQAGQVVRNLNHRLVLVEQRLDPANILTDEQAATVAAAVKLLAQVLGAGGGQNPYQGVWNELYRRFRAPDYKHIKRQQFEAVLEFLAGWYQEVQRPPVDPTTPVP